MSRTCSHCGKAGHYRPRCPGLAAAPPAPPTPKTPGERRAARIAARAEFAAAAPPPPAPARGPWELTGSERPFAEGLPRVFTWTHATTGERVTATIPRPAGGWCDTTEGLVVLRHPRDPVAYCAREMPSAVVTREGAPHASPTIVQRPVETAACGWGMW